MSEYIQAWRDPGDPTYLVRVGNGLYEMNDRANMPNGVCMYVGEFDKMRSIVENRRRRFSYLPEGVVTQVRRMQAEEVS